MRKVTVKIVIYMKGLTWVTKPDPVVRDIIFHAMTSYTDISLPSMICLELIGYFSTYHDMTCLANIYLELPIYEIHVLICHDLP